MMNDQAKDNNLKTTKPLGPVLLQALTDTLLLGTAEELKQLYQDHKIPINALVESNHAGRAEKTALLVLVYQTGWHCTDKEYQDSNEKALYLIREGSDLNRFKLADKSTILHHAVHNAFTPTVKALIEAGADLNALDEYGDSPLMWSLGRASSDEIKQRRKETFELLLSAGAKLPSSARRGDKGLLERSESYFLEKLQKEAPYLMDIFRVHQEKVELLKVIGSHQTVKSPTSKKVLSL